ncbi:MAG TPA: amidohydrolase [Gemmataceae bacterium]
MARMPYGGWTSALVLLVAGGPCISGVYGEGTSAGAVKARLAAVDERIEGQLDGLVSLYKEFHRNPELSLKEERTAARLAAELRGLGFEVTEKVGGTGVVGVFRNGEGPTVMVRTDMDALPVVERTGLPYASKVTVRDKQGREVGVMHACGHDVHMTCWIGAARVLTSLKDRWAGTLVFIGQPAEEIGAGARMMLDDGLFRRFPRPDYALALHADARLEAGKIHYTEGQAMANVDTVEVVVRGKGGHGAAPHTTIDPVVLSAKIILDLQTLVSREVDPLQPAVVTVGSIHGGTKSNVIPDEVTMQLTVRSTTDEVRKQLLDGIKRIAEGHAKTAGAPEPRVTVDPGEFTPSLFNDPELTRETVALFKEVLGEENVIARPPVMGGEDFARYGRAGVPVFMFFLGSIDADRMAASKRDGARPLPSMHSDRYYPVPEPTIRTGVRAMSMAVLRLVGK